jgi:hypothetical protein
VPPLAAAPAAVPAPDVPADGATAPASLHWVRSSKPRLAKPNVSKRGFAIGVVDAIGTPAAKTSKDEQILT